MDILTERYAWVTTPLPEGRLVLEAMSGHESLGTPFAYDLSLISLDANVDLAALLGQAMTVHLDLPVGERLFNGIVLHAEHGPTEGKYSRYQVTLCPWLSLLQFTSNCRIFQNKNVVDIIKQVFRDNGFSDIEDSLSDTYDPLEYCVQYRESDFNFVSRLMEKEGIYYFFKHDDGKHTLVLADGYSAHETTLGYETVPYKPPQENLEDDHLEAWVVTQQIRSGSYAATDFDFTRPRASLLSQLSAPLDNAKGEMALFDYPGKFLTTNAGNERVKIRLQEAQVAYAMVDASGNTRGLCAGACLPSSTFRGTIRTRNT